MAWGLGLYLPAKLYGGVGEMFSRIAEVRPELLQPPGLDAGGNVWAWGEFTSAILVSIIGFCRLAPPVHEGVHRAAATGSIRRTVRTLPDLPDLPRCRCS